MSTPKRKTLVKQLVRPVIIGFRYEDAGQAIQIAILRRFRFSKFLRRRNAVFLQHHHQHFSVDDRSGVKKFHA